MSLALSIPTEKQIRKADRGQLESYYRDVSNSNNAWIRKQVLEYNRIDILAIEVLGKQVEPFHLALLKYQFEHPENLQLCFRGAGKSTVCTEIKTIHLLLKNPNLRILIASKTLQNACGFLKNIKAHFETNTRLEEIFGQYYDPRRVGKWDEREIEVLPRTIVAKEASVTCIGVEGTVVSKHYDVIISDDLVDEDNSRSKLQRDKTRTWFYNTLMPTLEPPDQEIEHRGEHHMLGTRYHYDDLYGHLIDNELKEHHQIIPALDGNGRSPWPKKFPPKWFAERRKRSGLIIFNCQYQCHSDDTEFLTEDGWKLYNEVRKSKLATFDRDLKIVFQKPTKSICEFFDGNLIHLNGYKIDALVTPNHQMVCKPADYRKPKEWSMVDAELLPSISSIRTGNVLVPSTSMWNGKEVKTFKIKSGYRKDRHGGVRYQHKEKIVSMNLFSKFIGYFISEGATSKTSRGDISLSQSSGLVFEDMKKTLVSMGFDTKEYKCGSVNKLCIRHIGLWEWLRKYVKTNSGDARIPKKLKNLSSNQLKIMFDALIDGDGYTIENKKHKSYQYTSKSRLLIDDISELCLKIGMDVSINKSTKKDGRVFWRAIIRPGIGNGINIKRNFYYKYYKGNVVCFTVPNGTLITRRNGKILLSGNCDTEAMKGEIFQYDQCQQISEEDWPDYRNLRVFMGVDLAISESESADKFAIVVIGLTKDRSAYYVLDYYENQLRFKGQTKKILEYYRRWKPIRCSIETNQYQAAQYQNLKEENPDIRLKKVQTDKDKITRAWKLSAIFEDNKVFFRKGIQALLIEHMVLFPNHKYKDLFDAFDLAVQASKMKRKRRRRENEPGVM